MTLDAAVLEGVKLGVLIGAGFGGAVGVLVGWIAAGFKFK